MKAATQTRKNDSSSTFAGQGSHTATRPDALPDNRPPRTHATTEFVFDESKKVWVELVRGFGLADFKLIPAGALAAGMAQRNDRGNGGHAARLDHHPALDDDSDAC